MLHSISTRVRCSRREGNQVGKWGNFLDRRRTARERMLDEFSSVNKQPLWGLFVLVAFFIASAVFVSKTSSSNDVMFMMGHPIPLKSVTGAFSAVCNLCVVLMIVLYRSLGFYISLTMLVSQLPMLFISLLGRQNFSAISGIVTDIVILLVSAYLHMYVRRSAMFQRRMRDQASTDRISGIPNSFATNELMKYMIQKKEPFALAVIKLVNFGNINNTLGQDAGDDAIVQIAERMTRVSEMESTSANTFVATRKGNEFLLVVRDCYSDEVARGVIERFASALGEKFVVEGCDFVLNRSIGYSMFPEDAENEKSVFDYAYVAMEQARKTGDTCSILRFSAGMLNNDNSVEVERSIRHALDNGNVFYNLQPQFDMNHRLRGFEALARMRDEEGNVMSPVVFIPVAEKTGLVDLIDSRVLFSASKFIGDLVKKTGSDVVLSVNASVRHMMQASFVDEIRHALEQSGLPANQLEVEITESIMIESVDRALECIGQLTDLGVRISIDDFGTGYSSLSYLNSLPSDVIKVDRSFIITMNSSEKSKQYVAAIIALGHIMNFKVVAEGVEDDSQIETLRNIGCDYIQGFVWGKPMAPEAAAKLVIV